MGMISKNFDRAEYACKCNCGFDRPTPELVILVQRVRDKVGGPIKINSACRCKAHNKKVGGVPDSFHTTGQAADLACAEGAAKLFDLIKRLHAVGELPMLAYCKHYARQNFVHVDVGKKRTAIFAKG